MENKNLSLSKKKKTLLEYRKRERQGSTMASLSRNSLLVVLSLCLLITFSNVAEIHGAKLRPSECKPRCNYRCSATSHKKPCMFFCLKCCATCLCVPPGTYGNKETCPCYNNWKTKEGRPKCP